MQSLNPSIENAKVGLDAVLADLSKDQQVRSWDVWLSAVCRPTAKAVTITGNADATKSSNHVGCAVFMTP